MKSQNIRILKWDIFEGYPIKTGITTRQGGVSNPPYSSFNLATHTGDSLSNVDKNRTILMSYLHSDKKNYCSATQVHSDSIIQIDKNNMYDKELICDGLITNNLDPVLNIFVADCVPIVIYDKKNKVGGLCHCGWKGTIKKLLLKMIKQMENDFNSNTNDILIGIGPSIGSCCYNVSKDLYFKFLPIGNEGYVKNDKYYLDLKEINKNQALEYGILEENLEIMKYCTSCSNDMFYSYRKEGEPSGRFSCYLKITS